MAEGPPRAPTHPEGGEAPAKQEVIEALRANPEDRELLVRYIEKREEEVGRINTPRAGLDLTVELAEIVREAGHAERARELFEAALLQAEQRDEFAEVAVYCLAELYKLAERGL